MPRIFDNIDSQLLPALQQTIVNSTRADFSVGYFNLRGWQNIDDLIEELPGDGGPPCRVLVGMNVSPHENGVIGRVLARHDGFTEEELDFIINYDITYRMGRVGARE